MIRKTARGYVLYSSDGSRKLGGPYRTRAEALRRERQVQIFKHLRARPTPRVTQASRRGRAR